MSWPIEAAPEIILASASQARRELLESEGVRCKVLPTHCDESCTYDDPIEFPLTLAQRKMKAFLAIYPAPELPVITCDTIVEFRGEIIGKPENYEEAKRFIDLFSGSSHLVVSAYSLLLEGKLYSGYDTAEVIFHPLTDEEKRLHLEHIDYTACAGAYRIQNQVIPLIKEIKGHFATVVGLPLERISDILRSPHLFTGGEYPPHGEK